MWKYQHPDFALFLLGELQKQQQGSVFCDTLLQTEGVCVPAHSCVLAALSPVFSRILSSSPAPHAGQNRLLNLEAVGSHALLKLVGFLYTGEMEIESWSEHERIMAAALRLGLRSLLEKKRVLVKKGVLETGVQTEDCPRSQESEIVPEPLKVQNSTATSVQTCGLLDHELPPSSLHDEANGTEGFNLVNKVTGLSHADHTEASVANRRNTKTKRSWKTAKRESQFRRITRQQTQIKVYNIEGTKTKQIEVVERSRRVSGKDFQKLLEKKRGISEPKEAQVDQLKVKIKLSRRRGACWESNLLVSVQGESENAEEVKECAPQTQSCPSGTLPGQSLGTLTPPTDLTISPSNSSTHASSDKCLRTPHHVLVSSPLDIPALPSSSPQAEESDEQIAMLLEDMFMMGLNILPLMPLERNLDEQAQLDPLQDLKGGQRGSSQSACLFVQGSEPEMRKSDVSKKTAPVGSPGEKSEDSIDFQNRSSTNAVELLLSPGQDNLNTVNNLETVVRNSDPSLVEGLFLTPKTTVAPNQPSSGANPMTYIPAEWPEFKLLRCLSPLESENGDSDTPKQNPSHRQDPEMQNYPFWLSESPVKLDFPLSLMINSSCPRSQRDHIACQNRSRPDLKETQKLKTSCSQNSLTHGSSSSLIQPDVSDATQQSKQRETGGQTQRSTANQCQNHENEAEVQLMESKSDDLLTNNARRVSARIINSNRKMAVEGKRKTDTSSPIRRKRPKITNAKQHKHVDVVPKRKVTRVAKSRRGRPRKFKIPDVSLCNNEILPSGQGDCEVEKTKTNCEIEHGELSVLQASTVMKMADVNANSAMVNSQVKHTDHAKGPSILDQIFHQTLPSLTSQSSQTIGQQQTSNLQDSSFWLQESRGGKSEDKNSKLATNSIKQIDHGICAKEEAMINDVVHKEVFANQTKSLLPCPEEDVITELNNAPSIPNIQDQIIEISVPLTFEEDIVKDIMMPGDDQDEMLHMKTGCVVTTNELTEIEVNLCENSQPNLAPNEPSSEVMDNEKDMDQGVKWLTDCLEDIEEDLGTYKDIEMPEEVSEETDVLRAHKFVKENALLASGDVCWENTNGWDDDNDEINVEEDQYSAEAAEDKELNEGRIASPMIADDPSNRVLTAKNTQEIISTDAACVQTETSSIEKPHVCTEEVSTLLPSSDSKEDTQPDEEDIEVDVEGSVGSPLGLLAARQIVRLTIESPLDLEDESEDDEEEEEVDVTGEETD